MKRRKILRTKYRQTRNVLFESDNAGGFMHGFTGNYLKVRSKYNESFVNQVVEVKLDTLNKDGVFLHKQDKP